MSKAYACRWPHPTQVHMHASFYTSQVYMVGLLTIMYTHSFAKTIASAVDIVPIPPLSTYYFDISS